MPSTRHGKVKHLLKEGKAKVIKKNPFTIQLLYDTTNYTQFITLGIDSGYSNIGFSAISETKELISGEVKLISNQPERTRDRQQYRRQRRNKLRHRKPRFDNRRRTKGWLAPTIQNKLDQHIKLVERVKSLIPVNKTIIEVANFDIQAIKDIDIQGIGYQQGVQYGFWNLREYILHRDSHICQNPNCKHKKNAPKFDYIKSNIPLQVHHIGYWHNDRTDRPENLITLCIHCHTSANHKKGKFLYEWQPKLKCFKSETFMSIIRWRLVNLIQNEHTYGFLTKSKRITLNLEKTHYNDAFCIAGGSTQKRVTPLMITKKRRNNRILQKFYDAKYVDQRTGEKVSASDLHCGRRKRNKNLNDENLKKYRGKKISKGRITIRTKRYKLQPNAEVNYQGKKYLVTGVVNYGNYVRLKGLKKDIKSKEVQLLYLNTGALIC